MILFYLLCAVLALGTAAITVAPLLRARTTAAETESSDVALYRAQLAEIDRDLERGVLDAEDAAQTRTEVARRLLAADKAARPAPADSGRNINNLAAFLTVAAILLGGAGLYWILGARGHPDLPLQGRLAASEEARADRISQADMAARMPPVEIEVTDDYRAMVDRLRATAASRTDDLQGQSLLARHEANMGNFDDAMTAQRNVIRIKGDAVEPADKVLLLDMMVYQLRGYVSPEAEALAREILRDDASNVAAQYYLGLLYDQTDRPDVAFRIWRDILASGTPDPHGAMAERMIQQAADRAGIDYTPPEAAPPRGPSAEDMRNAENMSSEDRQQMIEGMVEQLSDRLANDGGSAPEWAQLIGALGVLGQTDRAAAIWGEAQQVFAARPDDLAVIRQAAARAGLE